MALSPAAAHPSPRHAHRLTSGLLLAGLGFLLLSASFGAAVAPPGRAEAAVGRAAPTDPAPSDVAEEPAPRALERDTWDGTPVRAAAPARALAERPARSDGCLGADLATGRRAESMHLATVPVQRPADCGDARDVIAGLASLSRIGRGTAGDVGPAAGDAKILPAGGAFDLAAGARSRPSEQHPGHLGRR
jgi:hypothetical protein